MVRWGPAAPLLVIVDAPEPSRISSTSRRSSHRPRLRTPSASVSASVGGRTGRFVLTLTGDRICAFTRFDSSVLPWFGLPRSLPGR